MQTHEKQQMNLQQWPRREELLVHRNLQPRPKAAVNKMKGVAPTAPHSPNKSDESDEPEEAEVKVEVEHKNKVDENIADDGTAGIQSVLEAASAIVSLSGAITKKYVPAVGPKKPNKKKPSPSKRKTLASKTKKPGSPK
jgi:hypothetical protein